MRRDDTFVLSRLAVDPQHQNSGIGRSLLDVGLAYAHTGDSQYIYSSADPRALHSYLRSGFTLNPTVRIAGRARPRAPYSAILLGRGTEDELQLVTEIDRAIRGSSRRADIEAWLAGGAELWLHQDGGYAICNRKRLTTLAAQSEVTATELLAALLVGKVDREPVEAGFVPANQQWAYRTAAANGATLEVHGAVFTRNVSRAPSPYLANALLG
jgi:hypothetical protein